MNRESPNILIVFGMTFLVNIAVVVFIAYKSKIYPHSTLDWLFIAGSYIYSIFAMQFFGVKRQFLQSFLRNSDLKKLSNIRQQETGNSGDLHVFLIAVVLTIPITFLSYVLQAYDYIGVGFASLATSTMTGIVYLRHKF